MNELLGKQVKLIMNSAQGTIVLAGTLVRIADPFVVILGVNGKTVFYNLSNIKSVEAL